MHTERNESADFITYPEEHLDDVSGGIPGTPQLHEHVLRFLHTAIAGPTEGRKGRWE